MEKAFEYLKELILVRLGLTGLLLIGFVAVGIYAWFQHLKANLFKERLDIEAESRRQMAQDLLQAKALGNASIAPATSQAKKQKRILIVDDDESVGLLMEYILSQDIPGVRILKSLDGDAAWNIIKTDCPDLILLDLMMPGKTGYEILQQIKSEKILVPVVVVSGFANNISEVLTTANVDLPNALFLSKPFRPADLCKIVRGWIG